MRFELHTLVDITETGARKGDDIKLARQQQNFLTVLQTIGLRVNPTYLSPPTQQEAVPSKLGFGSKFKKKEKIWTFTFDIDYESALDIETLINDFDLVPFITNLDETAVFKNNVFLTQNSELTNIIFSIDDK